MLTDDQKKAHEEVEQVLEMGQDSDKKAAKAVIEVYDEQEKVEKEQKAKDLEILKLQQSGIKNQVNVQINEGLSDGTKYGDLIQRLMNGTSV